MEKGVRWATVHGVTGRNWQPTPVLLPGEPHGLRSLVGYSPQGRKELDMTERLHLATKHQQQHPLSIVKN